MLMQPGTDIAHPIYPPNLRPVEGELMMIGMLLNENARVDLVADLLHSAEFYEPVFGRIYGRIVQLVSAGYQATPLTVDPFFANDEAYAELGARNMMIELTGTSAQACLLIRATDQAAVIAEAAARRKLIDATRKLEASVADPDATLSQLVDETDAALVAAVERREPSRLVDMGEASNMALDRIRRIKENDGKVGASTGIAELDNLIGGCEPGDLIVVAGRPGMGKTAVGCTISNGFARNGVGVFYASLEMQTADISTRMLSDAACRAPGDWVPFDAMISGRTSDAETERLEAIAKATAHWPVQIDDRSGVTLSRLALAARRVKRKMLARKQKLGVIIIDYMQLLHSDDKRASIYETVTATSKGLKELAKDLGVAVIALAQLSREVEKRDDKRPQLSDLRESGQIEQDADTVLFLFREEYYLAQKKAKPGNEDEHQAAIDKAKGKLTMICAKRRNGRTGDITLNYLAPYQAIRGNDWGRR